MTQSWLAIAATQISVNRLLPGRVTSALAPARHTERDISQQCSLRGRGYSSASGRGFADKLITHSYCNLGHLYNVKGRGGPYPLPSLDLQPEPLSRKRLWKLRLVVFFFRSSPTRRISACVFLRLSALHRPLKGSLHPTSAFAPRLNLKIEPGCQPWKGNNPVHPAGCKQGRSDKNITQPQ